MTGVSNDLSTTNAVYAGIAYVAQHPYVNDPVRPGKTEPRDRIHIRLWNNQHVRHRGSGVQDLPQLVLALKNQFHRFRKLGIAPIAAAGQFGAPLGAGAPVTTTTGVRAVPAARAARAVPAVRAARGGAGGARWWCRRWCRRYGRHVRITLGNSNNAANSSLGDTSGMSLPAVLNEVISVTGTYPFPFTTSPETTPIDSPIGVIPNPLGPVLVFGSNLSIGGTAGTTGTGGAGGGAPAALVVAALVVAAVALVAPVVVPAVAVRRPSTPMSRPSRRPTSRSITTGSWARSTAA